MSKAPTESMEELHGELARVLLDEIKHPAEDNKGRAAILNVARQFLKDNGIESLPAPKSPLGELAAALPFPEKGDDTGFSVKH